jgi:hypothetical protein
MEWLADQGLASRCHVQEARSTSNQGDQGVRNKVNGTKVPNTILDASNIEI